MPDLISKHFATVRFDIYVSVDPVDCDWARSHFHTSHHNAAVCMNVCVCGITKKRVISNGCVCIYLNDSASFRKMCALEII